MWVDAIVYKAVRWMEGEGVVQVRCANECGVLLVIDRYRTRGRIS